MNQVVLNKKVNIERCIALGFRNILVHQYQMLDLAIMVEIVEHRLDDLMEFANIALAASD